jgi:hypothetical protein
MQARSGGIRWSYWLMTLALCLGTAYFLADEWRHGANFGAGARHLCIGIEAFRAEGAPLPGPEMNAVFPYPAAPAAWDLLRPLCQDLAWPQQFRLGALGVLLVLIPLVSLCGPGRWRAMGLIEGGGFAFVGFAGFAGAYRSGGGTILTAALLGIVIALLFAGAGRVARQRSGDLLFLLAAVVLGTTAALEVLHLPLLLALLFLPTTGRALVLVLGVGLLAYAAPLVCSWLAYQGLSLYWLHGIWAWTFPAPAALAGEGQTSLFRMAGAYLDHFPLPQAVDLPLLGHLSLGRIPQYLFYGGMVASLALLVGGTLACGVARARQAWPGLCWGAALRASPWAAVYLCVVVLFVVLLAMPRLSVEGFFPLAVLVAILLQALPVYPRALCYLLGVVLPVLGNQPVAGAGGFLLGGAEQTVAALVCLLIALHHLPAMFAPLPGEAPGSAASGT